MAWLLRMFLCLCSSSSLPRCSSASGWFSARLCSMPISALHLGILCLLLTFGLTSTPRTSPLLSLLDLMSVLATSAHVSTLTIGRLRNPAAHTLVRHCIDFTIALGFQ